MELKTHCAHRPEGVAHCTTLLDLAHGFLLLIVIVILIALSTPKIKITKWLKGTRKTRVVK